MARFSFRRFPRGINFLLGGSVVGLGVLLFILAGGSLDLGLGAPDVRIDQAVGQANVVTR